MHDQIFRRMELDLEGVQKKLEQERLLKTKEGQELEGELQENISRLEEKLSEVTDKLQKKEDETSVLRQSLSDKEKNVSEFETRVMYLESKLKLVQGMSESNHSNTARNLECKHCFGNNWHCRGDRVGYCRCGGRAGSHHRAGAI